MARRSALYAGLVVLGLLGVGVLRGNAAHQEAGAGFVGAWRVNPTIGGQTAVALTTFNADGTLFTSNRPVQPAPEGLDATIVVQSLGHGSWAATGADTADITFVILQSDPDANFLGTRTIRGSLTLDPGGDRWQGTFAVTLADAVGAEVLKQSGEVEATRIVVEPVTPA